METYKEECEHKSETINKLTKQITDLTHKLGAQRKEIAMLLKRAQESDNQLEPVKKSLNLMTAAHGKLLRKTKRQANKS